MDGGQASVHFYLIFFFVSTSIAHELLLHRNPEIGNAQTLDFVNRTVNHGCSSLHPTQILGQVLEKMGEEFKIFVYPEEELDTSLVKNYEILMRIYAMERNFSKKLRNGGVLTDNPDEADLFFIPISCCRVKFWYATEAIVVARFVNYFRNLVYNYPYWNRTLGADHFHMTCFCDPRLLNSGNTSSLPKNAAQLIHLTSHIIKGFKPNEDGLLPKAPLQLPCPPDEHEFDGINTLEINHILEFDDEKIKFQTVGVKYCFSDENGQTRILACINNDSVHVIFSSNTDTTIHSQLLKTLNHTVEFPFFQN